MTVLTKQQIITNFPNGIAPTSSNGIVRDTTTKRITDESLGNYISNLIRNGTIPGAPPSLTNIADVNIQTYITKQNELMNNLKSEYEYYYIRYQESLKTFLNHLANSQIKDTTAETTEWLNITRNLNTILNDLYQIFTYLSSYYLTQTKENNKTINDINDQLSQRSRLINSHGDILNKSNANKELYDKMADYSKEKAKATNNLLSIYACMNMVALGILFYVYKST
jgi:hypothetical protein